jgi:uncharacterized protein YifE (UPF0438 family)
MAAAGEKRPSLPAASSALPERPAPARADARLVFGIALCYLRNRDHPAKPNGIPSLTKHEQDLLRRYQQFYLDLAEGRHLPETDAQPHFLKVAAGRLPPVTEHERLWVRWRWEIRDRNVRAINRRMGPGVAWPRPALTANRPRLGPPGGAGIATITTIIPRSV